MVWSVNVPQLEGADERRSIDTPPRPEFNPAPSEPPKKAPDTRSAPPPIETANDALPCENHIPRSCCGHSRNHSTSALERLFDNRDTLLLLGLILILMNEKADSKLILALAFVLLS